MNKILSFLKSTLANILEYFRSSMEDSDLEDTEDSISSSNENEEVSIVTDDIIVKNSSSSVTETKNIVEPSNSIKITDPKTDFKKAKVNACLWKPKRDHGHEAVVVFWSDNISYKDLILEVTNNKGGAIKVLKSQKRFVPASYYKRGKNVHGQYGGINYALPVSFDKLPKNILLKAIVINPKTKKEKYIDIFKFNEIKVKDPSKRVEVNYKTNNYKG